MSMSSEAERWFRQAEHDLENAQKTFEVGAYDVTAFLCQQAVEKGVKALILARTGEAPERSHSIQRLAQAAGLLGKLPRDALMLDDFYVAARYPDAVVEVPFEMFATPDAEAALRVAAESLDILRKELSGDG